MYHSFLLLFSWKDWPADQILDCYNENGNTYTDLLHLILLSQLCSVVLYFFRTWIPPNLECENSMKKSDIAIIDLLVNDIFYSLFISYQPIYFTKYKRSVSGKFPCASGISTLTSVHRSLSAYICVQNFLFSLSLLLAFLCNSAVNWKNISRTFFVGVVMHNIVSVLIVSWLKEFEVFATCLISEI